MRFSILVCVVVLMLSCGSADSADLLTETPFKVPQHWAGTWELSPQANQLLGFSGEEDRQNAGFDHPLSFTLSFDETPGKSLSSAEYQAFQDQVFTEKLGHRVVATGGWTMKFEVDPGFEEEGCFLTVKAGSTYLWKPSPYIVLYGGKISFLEGAGKSRDLLVIDFNPHPSEFPRHETVVYQRVQDPEPSKAELSDTVLTPERIETVRKTYGDVPPDILGVKEPIEVQWADMLFDGGTIFVKAKDAAGRVFHATLKYDESYLKLQGKSVADWAGNYQTHRIQFDFHRNVNHGPDYPIRGPEEAAVYGLLIRWSENTTYEPVGEKLQNYRQQRMDLFLSAMDYRFAALPEEESVLPTR